MFSSYVTSDKFTMSSLIFHVISCRKREKFHVGCHVHRTYFHAGKAHYQYEKSYPSFYIYIKCIFHVSTSSPPPSRPKDARSRGRIASLPYPDTNQKIDPWSCIHTYIHTHTHTHTQTSKNVSKYGGANNQERSSDQMHGSPVSVFLSYHGALI